MRRLLTHTQQLKIKRSPVAAAVIIFISSTFKTAKSWPLNTAPARPLTQKRTFPGISMSTTVATAAPQVSLMCNGEDVPCTLSSEDLLKEFPRGPYTTARTHMKKYVFEFEFHNSRIAESLRLMVDAGSLTRPKNYDMLSNADLLRDEYLGFTRKAVALHRKQHNFDGETKITTLLSVDANAQHQLYIHCQPLGNRPEKPVKIQVMGAPRGNAAAKDSAWVVDRQGLWTAREEDVHEVVLTDDDGSVYEGLSSNFFAIVRGDDGTPVLYTAGEGVLLGTVRHLAVQLCISLGIKVVEEPPAMKDSHKWEEVFISSTSRWVLPVGEVVMPDKSIFIPPSTKLTEKLYNAVVDNALENSTEL